MSSYLLAEGDLVRIKPEAVPIFNYFKAKYSYTDVYEITLVGKRGAAIRVNATEYLAFEHEDFELVYSV